MPGFEYSALTPQMQEQMLKQRILAFEQDHFGHEIAKQGLLTLPDSDAGKADAILQAESAQSTIEGAIAVAKEQLATLEVTVTPAEEPAVDENTEA